MQVSVDATYYSDTESNIMSRKNFIFSGKGCGGVKKFLGVFGFCREKKSIKKIHEMLIDFNDWFEDNWNVRNEEV